METAAQGYTFTDAATNRALAAFRGVTLVAYPTLVWAGILDVAPPWFMFSLGVLAVWEIYAIVSLVTGPSERFPFISQHGDTLMIGIVLISLHSVDNPIWGFYLLVIVGAAHFASPQELMRYVAFNVINYLGVAAVTAGLGHEVSWGYVVVVSLMIVFMGQSSAIIAGGEQRVRMVIAQAAATDSLTGLPNRRSFHEAYVTGIEDAVSRKVPLALMLLDVDHFKDINDTYGHPAGDDKLRELGQALGESMRRGDLVARYGGDEFVVLAPHATRDDAVALAERLRLAAQELGASLSIGVAMFPDDARQSDRLLEAADGALYRAKQAGRNCVRCVAAA